MTLSDKNVIKYLILARSKIDVAFGASTNINIIQAGDIFEFNQEVILLYVSLDSLIDTIKIKDKDQEFLRLIFQGHTIPDLIKEYNYPRKTAYRTLDRIANKIVKMNNALWKQSMKTQGYIT